MALAIPRLSMLIVIGFLGFTFIGTIGAIFMPERIWDFGLYPEDIGTGKHEKVVGFTRLLWFAGLVCAAAISYRFFRGYPLTYATGIYKIRRQFVEIGQVMRIGPVKEIAGKRLSISIRAARSLRDDLSVSFKYVQDPNISIHILVCSRQQSRWLYEDVFVIKEDSDDGPSAYEKEIIFPEDIKECEIVLRPSSCEYKKVKIKGKLTFCISVYRLFSPPVHDHFGSTRCLVNN